MWVWVCNGGITMLYKSTPSTINKQLGGEVISIICLSPYSKEKGLKNTQSHTHTHTHACTRMLIPSRQMCKS